MLNEVILSGTEYVEDKMHFYFPIILEITIFVVIYEKFRNFLTEFVKNWPRSSTRRIW